MQLRHLKDNNCPNCGSRTTSEGHEGTHTNGQDFERRTFACGAVIRWVPNFSAQEQVTPCPKHPDIVERDQKRQAAKAAILLFIDGVEADPDFKAVMKREVGYRY